MFDTAFQHIRTTANVGDQSCCPMDYFDFGRTTALDFCHELPACRRAIFGGGQVFRQSVDAAIYHSAKAQAKVIWGVGIDRKAANSLPFEITRAVCALISSRNVDVPGCEYVPCVSAMSPLFDAPPPPRHEVVAFLHARKSHGLTLPPGIPAITNHHIDLAEAIAHLANGATVITNSYHGTYWAMLLGRRVLCLPFSGKFDGFADPPEMATTENWQMSLPRARQHLGLLDDARARNRDFYDKVMNL